MAVDDAANPQRKPLPKWLSSAIPSSLTDKAPKASHSAHDASQDYLTGVRGCLAILSFLWVFMDTFVPAAMAGSANDEGSSGQLALRKSLSVLFWNGSLIYSSIIFLSARTICLPFLLDPSKATLASAVVRRGIRLWFPTAAALIMCYAIFTKTLGTAYLAAFAEQTKNELSTMGSLWIMPNSLSNFNSIFEVFWVANALSAQSGNWAFPTQTLWVITAVFQQSYTVYTTMVVIPYTRKTWRLYGAGVFILTAWWVYSWAWFSISGLLLADLVVSFDFKALCQAHRLRVVAVASACMVAGFAMQFLWVTAFPGLQNAEIMYHTGLYATGGLYTWNDPTTPQLRADDYLVIVGFYLFLESSDLLQRIFRNPAFVFLGRRSYSYFCLQSIIAYTLGIKTVSNMIGDSMDGYAKATGIAFIACLGVTLAAGEVFYWLFDRSSQKLARIVFAWIRE
ncbi:hypothetical protein LTR53_001447 [Teratosphaeriaceae sp. CCFEE 6253]|nr:hypothetical protein LTR53_001447 [Teratosphaeriaceae sp. CCFEE 6253]